MCAIVLNKKLTDASIRDIGVRVRVLAKKKRRERDRRKGGGGAKKKSQQPTQYVEKGRKWLAQR